VKRWGKSPPVLVATPEAVHLMGCKAMYISIIRKNCRAARPVFLPLGRKVEKGRPHDPAGNSRAR